jgi:sialate O-acetylesterase
MYSSRLKTRSLYFAFLLILAAAGSLRADVRLPAIFGNHMVLQQNIKVPVWGWADPGESITVALGGQTAKTAADANGKWRVDLAPLKASTTPLTLSVTGKNSLQFDDVLVGEVWLFSGQSNMELPTKGVMNHNQEMAAANFPQIRLFVSPHSVKDTPANDVAGSWSPCTPKSVADFSAVAYFTGRELFQKLNVPIGLIQATYSGTFIHAWMSHEMLQSDPDFKPLQDRWQKVLADYPQAKADYDARLPELTKAWQEAVAQAKADHKPVPSPPRPPPGPGSQHTPGGLYNGQLFPLAPFALRGFAWYQGEGNAPTSFLYRKELATLIKGWRELWGEGDIPFIVVQLPSGQPIADLTKTANWAEMRESQASALALPNTGLAVIIDLGDALHHEQIHPQDKQDVGHRVALQMEKIAYGMNVISSGPVLKAATVAGDSVDVEFGSAAGLKTKDGGPVTGFEIAGDDKKYVTAGAIITGDGVKVHADAVPHPKTVRYDWSDFPDGNLFNGADLPARPFRTDDFPPKTINGR